jgi:hypothetical protein
VGFMGEGATKLCNQRYAKGWAFMLGHENLEKARVKQEMRVQEALSRSSAAYVMHVLIHYRKPQHEKESRDDMFWEVKRAKEQFQTRKRMNYEHELLNAAGAEKSCQDMQTTIRRKRRVQDEDVRRLHALVFAFSPMG